jgi:hypothetical protein
MLDPFDRTSRDIRPVRRPTRTPARTVNLDAASAPLDPTHLAHYRWLLRRLFASDTTPPPLRPDEGRRAA